MLLLGTQLEIACDAFGSVHYEVNSSLQVKPFAKDVPDDVKMLNYYHEKFHDIDSAIVVFNLIQKYAEEGQLVKVVGM